MAVFEYDDADWLTEARETVEKNRVYVDDPSEVPEGYEAEQGPQGGTFYHPDGPGLDPGETSQRVHERPMATEEVPMAHIDDFEGVTLRFYDDGDPTETLDVVEVVNDPTTLMGPNAGYLVLEDGTGANLTGDRFSDDGPVPDDLALRALSDANAIIETEQYADPAGVPDPNQWDVRWEGTRKWDDGTDRDRDLLRLDADEKAQFMKEWRAACDDEAVENVEHGLRNIKGATTTTGAQFLDKVMKAAWGLDGKPRDPEDMEDRDFAPADDPTGADVEAAKVFTAASRKFMVENFGREFTLHRGFGMHVVDELYPVMIDRFMSANDNDPVTIQDNPVSTWTTDHKMANSYTKGVIARTEFDLSDVLSTPEAMLDFDSHQSIADWNEGEVNVPGWEMELTLSDLYLGKSETTFAELIADPAEAELADDSHYSPIESFVRKCAEYNGDHAIDAIIREIESAEATDELADVLDVAERMYDRAKRNRFKAETTTDVIDIREPGNWLVHTRLNRAQKAKSRVYVESPDHAPDDVQVHEGDRGGLYYDANDRYGENEGEAPPEKVMPRDFNTGQTYGFVADGRVFYGTVRAVDSDTITLVGETVSGGEVTEGEWTFSAAEIGAMNHVLWYGSEESTETAAALGVNLGRTVNYEGNVALKDDEKEAVRDALREKFGETQANYMFEITQMWKVDSYSDDAATRERTFVDALDDLDGKVRNSELDAAIPTPEMKEMAQLLTELSREFVAEQYGESHTAYRGIGNRAFTGLTKDVIRAWTDDEPPEEVEITMNPMTNFSHTRDVASRWGQSTAIIHDEFSPDDVVCATDALLTTLTRLKDEFEVSYKGGTQRFPAKNVELFGYASVDRVFEDPDPHEVKDLVNTALRGLDIAEADDALITGLRAVYRDAKQWEADAEYSAWPRVIQDKIETAFADTGVVLDDATTGDAQPTTVEAAVKGESETGFRTNVIELDLTEDPESVNWIAASREDAVEEVTD